MYRGSQIMMRPRQVGVIGETRQRLCVSGGGFDPAISGLGLSAGRMRTHECRGM